MDFEITLRSCELGEQFLITGECEACEAGVEYLLTVLDEPGDCLECPTDRAYCLGGSDIGPKPGYWRSSTTSSDFIECLYSPSCLGMVEPNLDPLGE